MASLRDDKKRKEIIKATVQNEPETQDHITQMQQGSSNILVAVRARPLTKKELQIDDTEILQVLDNNVIVLLDPPNDQNIPEDAFRQNRSREKQYAFDFAFNESTTQEMIFENTTKFLIDGVLNGFNATVFAYGSTGAGKTYTMIGEADKPGLMLKTFLEIFSKIEELSENRDYQVKLSYLEIYNEIVRDLVTPSQEALEIREDPVKGVVVSGLTEISATSPQHVINSIRNGNRRRTVEPTQANETSSRSHAVLQITVEHRDKASGVEAEILIGKLNLIDLAGSERAANTKNRGLRLIEGANINRSLLALGNCINALCEISEKNSKVYVPYRDSKLTRLLKDSLGGNCRTVMIACVSPFSKSFEETHNTLVYANRAKNIKTNVQRNVVNVQYHIARYTSIITQLRQEILDLRDQLNSKKPTLSLNTEKYVIELKNHFEEEARTRKAIHQAEQSIYQLKSILSQRNQQQSQISSDKGEENIQFISIRDEIKILNNTINEHKQMSDRESYKLEQLEKRRKVLETSWAKLGITEPYLSQLQLEMKDRILDLNSVEYKRKEDKHQEMLKQKQMLIQSLEDQLKVRDTIIDEAQHIFQTQSITLPEPIIKGFNQLRSFEQISAESNFALPPLVSPRNSKESYSSKSYTQLPLISGSRIPKPKPNILALPNPIVSDYKLPKTYSVNRSQLRKSLQDHKKNEVKRITKYSSASNSSNQSIINSEKSKKNNKNVSEKFESSPYVLNLSPNKEKYLKKERAAPGLLNPFNNL